MRWMAGALVCSALLGCAERLIHDVDCGDGVVALGEACFGDARESIAVAFTPVATRVADFDGDDDDDVLVLGVDVAAGVTSAIARNDGEGVLAPAIDAGMYGCSAHPALGDADGDAAIDLLVATCDSAMLVFPATTTGRFATPAAVEVGALPRTSAIVDVDGDAIADVVALGVVGDAAVLAWARGTSSFA
ncbi:MAG: hypothetical protein IAG13_19085, partial [Deltaproteobacteria bacterium]|nr:hypothetical protein [Nannocystaceae bacterium]